MKKLKNLKARLLSLSLAFTMVLSLAMGMAPMNVHAEGEPTSQTYELTIDCHTFDTSATLAVIRYDDDGNMMDDGSAIIVNNEDIISIPVGGHVTVVSDSSNIKVTVDKPDKATVGEFQSGGGLYGYNIKPINDNITIIVEPKSQGGDQGGGTEQNNKIQDLAGKVAYNESTKKITVDLDPSKQYVINFIPYEMYAEYGFSASRFNENYGLETRVVDYHKGKSILSSLTSQMIEEDKFGGNSSRYFTYISAPSELISGQDEAVFDVVNGAFLSVCEVKASLENQPNYPVNYEGYYYYVVCGIHAIFIPAAADTATVTFVKSNFNGSLEYLYDSEFHQVPEGLVMEIEKGSTLAVASDTNFTLTVPGSAPMSSNYLDFFNKYLCEIENIQSDLTITVAPAGQGGGENPPAHQHSWSETWTSDENYHWKTCSGCSEVKDKVEHSWEQGVDERFHWGYCSVCGYEENKLEHYEDDTTNNDYMCDYCKYALPCDSAWRVTIDSRNFDGNLEGYARDINDNQIVFNREGHRFFIGEVSALNVLKGSKIDLITNAECTIAVEGSCGEINSFIGGETGDRFVYQIMNISGDITIVLNPQASAPTPTPNPTPNPDNGSNGGSNGGSSSSSDSSSTPSTSTPSTSTPSTAPITVPVSNGGNDNVVNINASLSGETAKVNELTAEEINKVAKNETEKSIEINLSGTGKKIKEAALPVSSLNEIARIMDDPSNKLDNVTIKLSTATVEVSEHTLKAVLSKTTGNDLRLVVDDVQKDTLNNTQKEAVKNQNVHQCIDAYFISNGVRIGDFQGGTATIRLPFNVPEGLNGNGFSVWYVGDDGRIEKHDTKYVNGELVFTVSHFSDYVVVYDDAVKDDVPKTGEAADYSTMLWTSILAIGVVGLVLNRQKKRQ